VKVRLVLIVGDRSWEVSKDRGVDVWSGWRLTVEDLFLDLERVLACDVGREGGYPSRLRGGG